MKIKTLLSLGALATTGLIVFSKNKYGEYRHLLNSLQLEIEGIKDITFKGGISFKIDIQVSNPTNTAIDIPGNQLVIKNLHFYTLSGKKIGMAHPNISNINLPARSFRLLTNIPVSLSLIEIGNNFDEILAIVGNKNNLKIAADIEAFGKEFTLNA